MKTKYYITKTEYNFKRKGIQSKVNKYIQLCDKANNLERQKIKMYLHSFGKETSEIISKGAEIDKKVIKILEPLKQLDIFYSKLTDTEIKVFNAYYVDRANRITIVRDLKLCKSNEFSSIMKSIESKWYENYNDERRLAKKIAL